MRRNKDELNKMRKAGNVVAEMHEKTRAVIKPGVKTVAKGQENQLGKQDFLKLWGAR